MKTRTDEFAPIADYAGLGDGRTVALVAKDGRIDWWAVPTLDAPPVLAAILDPEGGGFFSVAPVDDFEVSRDYDGDSNVLVSTYTTSTGSVRITDALNTGMAGRLPWLELARRVDGVHGTVSMRWEFRPGTRFGSAQPWTRSHHDATIINVGDQHLALCCFDAGRPNVEPHRVSGEFAATEGSTAVLAAVATDHEPVFLPKREHIEGRLRRTVQDWHQWCEEIAYDGPWEKEVRRSALALKLLLYSPTGAIAAAPTTSLPEVIGGDSNYDYRYAWIRDASFTLDAMMRLGMTEEVHAAVSWLLDTLSTTAPDIHVFYRLDGRVDETETELDVPGYCHSKPVRVGNTAAQQTQLGTFGDLFDMIWRYVEEGHVLDADTDVLLAGLADRCCDQWRQPDSGIWELEEPQHYTISKMGCWVALDRAIRLADAGQLTGRQVHRWAAERDEIQSWVHEHCWSTKKRAYTFYAGTDDLDAAVLLAGRTGFDRGERLATTVDAIRDELSSGPLLYRYTGMVGKEGAFVACGFWLVDALTRLNRLDDAKALMDKLVAYGNDVGLFAEEVDPESGAMLGNFPQGLSHLALINAAAAYHDASNL